MENNTVIYVIGGIILAIIAYYAARYLKGSLTIVVPRNRYTYGERLQGSIELEAKKDIECNELAVAIVATEISQERHNGKTRTRSRQLFHETQTIERDKSYHTGYKKSYLFEFTIPRLQTSSFSGALSIVSSFLGTSTKVKWSIEVHLDAKGVDLSDSKKIYVS